MLAVKHGPFSALESSFISRLRTLVSEGIPTNAAVIAPSRRLADRLERLAAVEHNLPLLGVQFHTFHSLAVSIIEAGGFPDKRLISDPVFHDRLVDHLLEEKPSLANFFGGQARPRALAAALRSSLRDLIDAGIDAEALEEHFGDNLLKDPHERERLRALLSLAKAYEDKLEKLGILSSSGLIRVAAQRAEDSPFLKGFKEILYYGFYDLTGLQLEFFDAVVSRHPATLYFPFRRSHPAFRFAEPFFEEKLQSHQPTEVHSTGNTPALQPALDKLFGPGSAQLPKDALKIISASGARDEAWAAAKEILKLADSGVPYENIGVVARVLEPYRNAVAEVFTENAIPYDLGSLDPLLRQPLAKGCLNLLKLRQADFPSAVVEDLFSSPYFRPQPGAGSRRLWHWRQAIRTLGIRAGWLQWRGKLEGRAHEDFELYPGRPGVEGYKIPRADMEALWDWIAGLERELGAECATWAEMTKKALAIIERHWGLTDQPAEAETASWEAVRAVLDSLALFDLLGGKPTWEEFLDSFEQKLKRASLDTGNACRGVRVMDAMDARGQSFKVLIIVGLKEKLFPRLVQEDPLLREPARAALRHPAGYWIARKAAGYEEERLLFYLTAAAATQRVVCVYPRSDEAGKAQVPSLYLRELCRAAGVSMEGDRVPRQPAEKLAFCEPDLLSPKEFSLSQALDGVLPDNEKHRVEALNRFGKPGALDGVVGPPEDFLKHLRREGLSPSALDSFAQCPFKYFADRVLGLGSHDEGTQKGEFAAWVRGKIYHAVLEKHYSGAKLEAAIETIFAEYDWKKMGVYPVLWLSSKQTMSAFLRDFVAWDEAEMKVSGLKPHWLEKSLTGDWPGAVPAALEGLCLKGVIDRVDVDASGEKFRIIDYKSRWRKNKKLPKLIASGQLHQLPLYAELARVALGSKSELAEAAIYAIEDSPEISGHERVQKYEGADWGAQRKVFFELVAHQLEAIAAGNYMIKPDDGDFGYCGYCEFSSMCRKNHGPSRSRAAAAA
jgi:ATP-dependent helicase/DNAse subunit B